MLDSLRRKDTTRPGYTPPQSPYGKMQEALSTPPSTAPNDPPKTTPTEVLSLIHI